MDTVTANFDITLSLHTLLDHLNALSVNQRELPILPSESLISRARQSLPDRLHEEENPSWAKHLIESIIPALNGGSLSPNYYGFVTGGCTPAALFGDVLASIFDQNVHVHLPKETIATYIEDRVLKMLLDLFQLDRSVWGCSPTLTTGATASNVLGLGMGREHILRSLATKRGSSIVSVAEHGLHDVLKAAGVRKVQVLSTMPHSSVAKAGAIVGIGRANVISVAKKDDSPHANIGIDWGRLEIEAEKLDVANILVISAGEVNTGHFATNGYDEMKRLRAFCDKHGIWMHIDGAFGLFSRIFKMSADDAEFSAIVRGGEGLELADSITGDGHKLLNMPYDCGFYFCRHKGIAQEVFRNGNAAYLTSGDSEDSIASPLNIGIENSRRFRALPAYATLIAYGRNRYTDMLRRQIRLARKVVAELWESKAYEVLPKMKSKSEIVERTFMVVLFRAVDHEFNHNLVQRINKTGKMYVSGTAWQGQPAARIAIANWGVDVDRDHKIILDILQQAAEIRHSGTTQNTLALPSQT